jgi:hypothetical protein
MNLSEMEIGGPNGGIKCQLTGSCRTVGTKHLASSAAAVLTASLFSRLRHSTDWPVSCVIKSMRYYIHEGPVIALLALMTLFTPSLALAGDDDGASLAFARFVSRSAPGTAESIEVGDVAVEIQASLPQMGKQGRLEAIRHRGPTGAPEYAMVSSEGDSTVKQQVIARYLTIEQQASTRRASSFAVTPDNYKFRYLRSVTGSGGNRFYVFVIRPRHRGEGLIKGLIWIDGTGALVHEDGELAKRASVFIRRVGMVRDTGPCADSPYTGVTHIEIETRLFGRAELTIRERPVVSASILEAGQ